MTGKRTPSPYARGILSCADVIRKRAIKAWLAQSYSQLLSRLPPGKQRTSSILNLCARPGILSGLRPSMVANSDKEKGWAPASTQPLQKKPLAFR
ncbi:hypothetical protein Mfla_2200 [Methylobacillus flagellatus KT]|uniref:Uncharacterized protein n=1 Tax=Methylobacillus flagellatus (strain ATCC 51484 / DSM 6875 / VKM B-1610 / KT) TaxID=265072 RepID=Q1GZ70_METFK|nr:hypothetical protein Mfla_2200 [Methylobacillus flagellatus KT]